MTKLLIDMGYASFYRFYATKTWYKFSHPEEDISNIEWENNAEFMDKFEKMFLDSIETVLKKFNISWDNVILAQDCSRNSIWRLELYSEYKKTREAAQIRSGFNGHNVFKYISQTILPNLRQKYNVKVIRSNNAEADDVIACLTKIIPNEYIYILANDTDYLQLTNNRVHLIDFKCKERTCEDSTKELWKKILMGDTSDNIPSCKIDQQKIYPNRNNRYIKCGKKILENIFEWDNWEEKILESDIFENNLQYLNQKLISFDHIPDVIFQNVQNKFLGLE